MIDFRSNVEEDWMTTDAEVGVAQPRQSTRGRRQPVRFGFEEEVDAYAVVDSSEEDGDGWSL